LPLNSHILLSPHRFFFSRATPLTADQQLAQIDRELAAVKKQLRTLEARQRALERQRAEVLERVQQAEADRLQNQNWGRRSGFPWSQRLDEALARVFKLNNYRSVGRGWIRIQIAAWIRIRIINTY